MAESSNQSRAGRSSSPIRSLRGIATPFRFRRTLEDQVLQDSALALPIEFIVLFPNVAGDCQVCVSGGPMFNIGYRRFDRGLVALTHSWSTFRSHYRLQDFHVIHMTYYGNLFFTVEVYKSKQIIFYPPSGLCECSVIGYEANVGRLDAPIDLAQQNKTTGNNLDDLSLLGDLNTAFSNRQFCGRFSLRIGTSVRNRAGTSERISLRKYKFLTRFHTRRWDIVVSREHMYDIDFVIDKGYAYFSDGWVPFLHESEVGRGTQLNFNVYDANSPFMTVSFQ